MYLLGARNDTVNREKKTFTPNPEPQTQNPKPQTVFTIQVQQVDMTQFREGLRILESLNSLFLKVWCLKSDLLLPKRLAYAEALAQSGYAQAGEFFNMRESSV
jgi:hypothetical protein